MPFLSLSTLGNLAKPTSTKSDKNKRKRLVVEDQLEILRRFENGEKHAHIAKDFGVHQSCVYAIIKRKEKLNKFKDMNGAFGSSVSNIKSLKGRSPTIETMERLLVNWIGKRKY